MLDNSAYSINGDYLPTRWESQVDAASLLIQAKLNANSQSSVGLGLMAGKQIEILCKVELNTKNKKIRIVIKALSNLNIRRVFTIAKIRKNIIKNMIAVK